jgi:hypothetical protein
MSDETGNVPNQGDVAQEILDKILSDPDFRKQLLDNPAETLKQAGYIEGDDVSGYMLSMHVFGKPPTATKPLPATTAIDCGGGGGGVGTTAINCGGGGVPVTGQPKPKPPVNTDSTYKA